MIKACLALLCLALACAVGAVEETAPPAIELNRATLAQLDGLRGVGPALSERMLAARTQAPFSDWADLLRRVKGIGPQSAAKLSADGLRVNGQAFDPLLSKS